MLIQECLRLKQGSPNEPIQIIDDGEQILAGPARLVERPESIEDIDAPLLTRGLPSKRWIPQVAHRPLTQERRRP